jgi:hypothetical protein
LVEMQSPPSILPMPYPNMVLNVICIRSQRTWTFTQKT